MGQFLIHTGSYEMTHQLVVLPQFNILQYSVLRYITLSYDVLKIISQTP